MIQYFHNQEYGSTVAIEVPLKSDLLDLFSFGNKSIIIDIGVSYLHPKDQYNRSIGRNISKSKMKKEKMKLTSSSFPSEDTIHIVLESPFESRIVFRVHNKSEKVYLLSALHK